MTSTCQLQADPCSHCMLVLACLCGAPAPLLWPCCFEAACPMSFQLPAALPLEGTLITSAPSSAPLRSAAGALSHPHRAHSMAVSRRVRPHHRQHPQAICLQHLLHSHCEGKAHTPAAQPSCPPFVALCVSTSHAEACHRAARPVILGRCTLVLAPRILPTHATRHCQLVPPHLTSYGLRCLYTVSHFCAAHKYAPAMRT
jgi:hypothetical protein